MAEKGDRDAFLIDIQSTEDLELTRNKVLLFHPKASSVQRLLSHPLYAFARPWSRSQHPSYKSQDGLRERSFRKISRLRLEMTDRRLVAILTERHFQNG